MAQVAFSRLHDRGDAGTDGAEPAREELRSRTPEALFSSRSRAGRTGLQLREGLAFEAWCRIGRQVGAFADASAWWIGDWLVYGQRTYPDRYRSAMDATGFSYQTLRNYAWVAARFPLYRRRDALSFGHHAELAPLPEAEQEAWLLRAIANGWSRNALRDRLRQPRAEGATPVGIALHVEEARHERWRAAANVHQRPLSEWITDVLDRAAAAALEAAAQPI